MDCSISDIKIFCLKFLHPIRYWKFNVEAWRKIRLQEYWSTSYDEAILHTGLIGLVDIIESNEA